MVGAQEPRIKVVPEGVDHPRWDEIVDFVEALDIKLDPWQWMALRIALMRKGALWAAFTVAICAPRQNGKNGLLEPLELIGPLLLGEKLIIHTAHLADTSKEAFRRLDDLIDAHDWLSKEVKHVWRTNGMETIEFKGGRRIRFRTRTKGGGRGYAGCSRAIFDESMFLPEFSLGSILPVISAMPDPQIIYTGSAVDQEIMEDGVVFSRVRNRALKGDSDRLAYLEWSLDAATPEAVDEDDASDPKTWASTNPAYGLRIMPDYVTVEREELDSRTFAVERLGVGDWPDPAKSKHVIDLQKWAALADAGSELLDPVCFSFDVSPDRSHSSIAVSGMRKDGLRHLELIERGQGTRWITERLLMLDKRHENVGFVYDAMSPAASLSEGLMEAGLTLISVSASEHAQACGNLFDAVHDDQTIRHLGQPELQAAIKGATKRPLGDAWAWSRRNSSIDISPLVSVTLAHWGALTQNVTSDPVIVLPGVT